LKTIKRRYLALEIDCEKMADSGEFMGAVWDALVRLYGEHGASQTGLGLIHYDSGERYAVIRTGHTALDMVRAALASMTQIRDKPAAVHVLRISGTIKALHKETAR